MAHPCDDRVVSISVRDLAALLNAAAQAGGSGPFECSDPVRLDIVLESYEGLLTRMANGSDDWMEG